MIDDVLHERIRSRVKASAHLTKEHWEYDERVRPLRELAVWAINEYQDIIADVLDRCLSSGVTGRNQEEHASRAVMKALRANGYLNDLSQNDIETLEDMLDMYIQPMRVYDDVGYQAFLEERRRKAGWDGTEMD